MQDRNTNFVPRVTQLDALELDEEVVRVLKDQLVNAVKFSGSSFLTTWEPELELILKCLIWKFSAVKSNATFGQQLLGIKYGGESNHRKVWLLALITFGAKYLQTRSIEIANVSTKRERKDMIHRIANYLEMGILISRLVNFLKFLREGKYPSLAHRMLGLTLVPIDPGKSRTIGYSYMTRELLWHGFIELLSFTLPLINYHYIKRRVYRLFTTKEAQKGSEVKFTNETLCPICGQFPVLPQTIGCAHVYCYYCLTSNLTADPKFECAVCGYYPQDTYKSVKM